MRRGTTPTLQFNMADTDWSSFPSVILTLLDKHFHSVFIGQEDLVFSTDDDGNHLISATLTQAETLQFDNNSRVKAQIRAVDEDGNAFATDIVMLRADEILLNCVIDENAKDIPTPRPVYACSVTVGTVTTLEPTEDAYITNTGTNKQAVFNFGIPRGKDGEKGDKGDKGDAGSLGSITASIDDTSGTPSIAVTYDGTNADFAFSGLKGAKGDTGATGEQGIQGIQGEQGIQGVQGERGEKGDTGSQGVQGEKGDKGDTGAAGVSPTVTTEQTATGATITITDATGTHTATIANGAKGDTGSQGEQGIQGIQGETGAKGDDGYSPTVATTTTATGVIITITDKDGEHTATVANGSDYVLTDDDKTEIRDAVYALIEDADEVSY